MIWFLIVPAAWMVISALLGLLIGQCIRQDHSGEANVTSPGTAEAATATSPTTAVGGAEAAAGSATAEDSTTASAAHPAGSSGGAEGSAQRRDRTYAAAR